MIWRYQPEVEGGPMRTEPLPYRPTSIQPRYPQNMPQNMPQQLSMSGQMNQGGYEPQMPQMNQQMQMMSPMSMYQPHIQPYHSLNSVGQQGMSGGFDMHRFLNMLMNGQQFGNQQMNQHQGFM